MFNLVKKVLNYFCRLLLIFLKRTELKTDSPPPPLTSSAQESELSVARSYRLDQEMELQQELLSNLKLSSQTCHATQQQLPLS